PVERTATVELAVVRYAYRLEVELSGPTGPRAVVSDPTTGARSAFTAPGRAVLLYLLARRVVADRAAGVPLADRGWCTDAEVASGVWGRSGETRSLNVLVTRVRNDLRRDGFDPWFLEKRHGFVRVRLDAVEVST
ncbi:MAG: hypothetical protein ABMB14_36610, partial [Myxococcota bacterium]